MMLILANADVNKEIQSLKRSVDGSASKAVKNIVIDVAHGKMITPAKLERTNVVNALDNTPSIRGRIFSQNFFDDIRSLIQTGASEYLLHKEIKNLFSSLSLENYIECEFHVVKDDRQHGRIDILILPDDANFGEIIELKGANVTRIIRMDGKISRPVDKAIVQVNGYGRSSVRFSKWHNICLSKFKRNVVIGKSTQFPKSNFLVVDSRNESETGIGSWESFINRIERIFSI